MLLNVDMNEISSVQFSCTLHVKVMYYMAAQEFTCCVNCNGYFDKIAANSCAWYTLDHKSILMFVCGDQR